MAVDAKEIMEMAEKLGQLVAKHPAVERYRQAQKALSEDPDAGRLVNEFNRQLMTLSRQEEQGMPVTDAQRMQLEMLQTQLAAHLKVKAMNLAQVEFVDLMRRVSDTIRKYASEGPVAAGTPQGQGQPSGPKLVM
jgi:cell fate (sporulation/competence/biofilm development) regulator YlbF (YheA/YmcA/DUF963 family)